MKCAGSSIELSLLKNCNSEALCTGGTPEEEEMGYSHRNNIFKESGKDVYRFHSHTWPSLFFERIKDTNRWNQYKKITVVRNPWDTVVSWYWWSLPGFEKDSRLLITEKDSQDRIREKFKLFLEMSSIHDSVRPDSLRVFSNPLSFISETNEKFIDPCIDYYIVFENIQKSYNSVCIDLNLSNTLLLRLKSSQRILSYHYSKYFSQETENLVREKFKKTIKEFNYTFDHIC
jgi:hypothetical protein